jgi:hypothetical protein
VIFHHLGTAPPHGRVGCRCSGNQLIERTDQIDRVIERHGGEDPASQLVGGEMLLI